MHYGHFEDAQSRVIGLTGGIATGKTTLSNYLSSHYGLIVLDADCYAREAVVRGSEGLQAIVERYGPNILGLDHGLDRSRLAELIFQNPMERQWLESLIHPYVRDRLTTAAQIHQEPITVMDIPLLFEAGMMDLVSEIWVVYCTPQQQLSRLMARNHLSEQAAQMRIESQMPLREKCDRADVVLDNSGAVEALYAQVDQALQRKFA